MVAPVLRGWLANTAGGTTPRTEALCVRIVLNVKETFMKSKISILLVGLMVVLAIAGCAKKEAPAAAPSLKVGMVTDAGTIDEIGRASCRERV